MGKKFLVEDKTVAAGKIHSTHIPELDVTTLQVYASAAITFSVVGGVIGGGVLDTLTLDDGSTTVTLAAGSNKVITINAPLSTLGIKIVTATSGATVTAAIASAGI